MTLSSFVAKSLAKPDTALVLVAGDNREAARMPVELESDGQQIIVKANYVTERAIAFAKAVLIAGTDVVDVWEFDGPVSLPPNTEWDTTLVIDLTAMEG